MKKMSILIVIAIVLLPIHNLFAQGNAESIAKDVINAYKTKDVALLKKHMTGMMLYVINDDFYFVLIFRNNKVCYFFAG